MQLRDTVAASSGEQERASALPLDAKFDLVELIVDEELGQSDCGVIVSRTSVANGM